MWHKFVLSVLEWWYAKELRQAREAEQARYVAALEARVAALEERVGI